MTNTTLTYSDSQIMKALLTRDFSGIGGEFIDDVVTSVKTAAFMGAQNLTRVSLPSIKTTHYGAFKNAGITTLDIPWEQMEGIGAESFMGTSGLPQTLTLTNLQKMGNGAFAGTSSAKNTQLRTVSIPSWTGTSFSDSGLSGSASNGAFSYCSAMTSFSAPELLSIANYMFQFCTALTELSFPKLTTVGGNSFNGCSNLKKISLGGAIKRLSSACITNCPSLEAIILSGVTSVPTASASFFSNTTVSSGSCYVYVPKALVDSFKVASYWSTYASQIRAIEDYPDICGS